VLVAEDDAAIRDVVAEALTDEGYAVTAVANGQEALDSCQAVTPDVVLLDLMMPVMSGFQFLKRGPDGCSAPVIVMSAGFRFRELPAETHVEGFVEKPFDLVDLVAAVERCIGPAQGTDRAADVA
jgi:two-component system alkaline phosphatase synthesis response regulator PhoP